MMENKINFKVYGKFALFTDPLTRVGGEKCSYHLPTYEALKGVLSSIYWKPTFIWYIDKVRVMNRIKTQSKSIKPVNFSGIYPSKKSPDTMKEKSFHDLSIYSYLADVEYQVEAHFEWNLKREDMKNDRIDGKHFEVAKRMIERGGRRDIFLGTRECQAYVEPCKFGDGKSHFDESEEIAYGLMFHGFDYPDELGVNELHARFWWSKMNNGYVEFPRPEKCEIRKKVKNMTANPPKSIGLDEEGLVE